jgi:hypothetical protein
MSRHYSDNYHPSSNRFHPYQYNSNSNYNSNYRPTHHHNKNRWHSNSYSSHNNDHYHNRRLTQDRETLNAKVDDQIAPKDASRTISTLQQWALATADIPQFGPRSNETQIIERIELRYGSFEGHSDAPFPRHSNGVEEHSEATFSIVDGKRLRDASPPAREGLSAVAYVRDVKRRWTGEPATGGEDVVIDLTEEREQEEHEVDYAQSSEWSWPRGRSDLE